MRETYTNSHAQKIRIVHFLTNDMRIRKNGRRVSLLN